MTQESRAPLVSLDPVAAQRRRTAPRAEATSDVTRFRGVWFAALVALLVTALGLVASVDRQRERRPGPLSRPHRQAGLDCASCHVARDPGTRCVSCHGAHASTRPGHARARERGELTCVTCHAVHSDMQGVMFSPNDGVIRYGTFGEEVVAQEAPAGIEGVVPVVPARACATCHTVKDPEVDDPISRCLLASQRGLGPEQPALCFDEHRVVSASTYAADGSARERLALWDATRAVLERAPRPKRDPVTPTPAPWEWLVAAVGVAVVAGGAARLAPRLRGRAGETTGSATSTPLERRRLPVIDTATCIGCSACVDVCPYDVFEIRAYVARVVKPDDCCGLTLCEQKCPNGSLVVTDGELIEDRPAVDETLASLDVPGVYLAGDLTGMPLIRNAINQGAAAVQAAAISLRSSPSADAAYDVLIVGSGPAGLSAALQAKSMGLTYVVLEQGSVASSIRSFPRAKLVFDQPLDVPLVGELWLAEATKEELLGKWLRIVRAQGLAIREGTRVTAVDAGAGPNGSFLVRSTSAAGERVDTARRVVLALGRRGTPRKLPIPIPDPWMDRVHYAMADAQSFAGRRVLIVGLGDVAMETAIAVARQPGSTVDVVYRGDGFRRGKARNVAEVRRLIDVGRIVVHWSTRIESMDEEGVMLEATGGRQRRAFDAVFVMIGTIVPWEFLERVGIRPIGADRVRTQDA